MSLQNSGAVNKDYTLAGKTVANLFFEDSTRTRFSFEVAAKKLSANLISFSAKGSSVSKGESLKDTVLTLEAMGVDALVVRHHHSGASNTIANSNWSQASVINAGDGTHQHPTQALTDALTIRMRLNGAEDLGGLSGVKVLIVGDILHSRVARSNLNLLETLGAKVSLAGPSTLLPNHAHAIGSTTFHNFDTALENDFDVVLMLRMQRERMNSSFIPSENEYAALWQLSAERFSRLRSKALILHPGPMNRGLEISSAVADSTQSGIVQQVSNGVAVRMAVLQKLVGQGTDS
jgi:aspartate carbamoyltransferase catalytic subunit